MLRQMLESATDAPSPAETEPVLPAPETLASQFNSRCKSLPEFMSISHNVIAKYNLFASVCICFCRTVFILSEALDEQLKTLWFSPFQTDDVEADLDMVSA